MNLSYCNINSVFFAIMLPVRSFNLYRNTFLIKLYKNRCLINSSPIVSSCIEHRRSLSLNSRADMKFVQFRNTSEEARVGYLKADGVVDLNALDTTLPNTLLEILKTDQVEKCKSISIKEHSTIPLECIKLLPPISGMDKVLCVGLNYKDHCAEQNLEVPKVPMIFSKFASCVIGPEDSVRIRHEVTRCVDWEVELVLVIGKVASNVRPEDAFKYIMGYTVAQDISGRDWQKTKNGGQFLLGKAMDTFCPIGPSIVTSDEIPDPQCLDIKCTVNGVLKQSSNTEQLAHKIPDIIARLSSVMTLLPGDIILTGTPGGVGMYRDPPEYLKHGDQILSEIQCIGQLTTKVENF